MKATLEFNLPDDQIEFDLATQGGQYYSVLWDLDQHLRNDIKYNENAPEIEREYAENLREILRDIMFKYNVKF